MKLENFTEPEEPFAELTESNGNLQDEDQVAGLAASTGETAASELEEKPFDPLDLLGMDQMPVEKFFGVDRDKTYRVLHRLQSLPDDNPMRAKALRILELLENGGDAFHNEHPDTDIVNFNL